MPRTSTEPVVDKGIRQKSIHSFHSVHSFPDGSAFCPGAPKRVPSDSEKHRRVYTSSNVCHSHEWRVDTASGLTLKKQNACLHAVRHAVGKKIACIHGLRSEGVKQENIIMHEDGQHRLTEISRHLLNLNSSFQNYHMVLPQASPHHMHDYLNKKHMD